MTRDQISRLLTSITGNLQVSSATDKKSVDDLQQTLESVLLSQTTSPDATKRLTFANADFFASRLREKVSTDFKDRVVNKTDTQLGDNEMHVVVRDSPIRSTQIAGSMTKITAGARITKTIGPLKDISGRDLFFDFIRIQKLIPLYIQGNALPALLFKSTFLSKTRRPIGTKPGLTQQYSIDANTIWIAARIFDAAAPQDLYFGLRVKSGSLLLSAAPVFNGDKVTIAATTTATIALNLEQKVATLPAADDTYGLDATACELLLPETFNFSFTGNTKNIQEISALTCKIYGEQYTFSYNGNLPSGYNGILNRICFPIKCDCANFTVTDSKSPFLKLDGSAPITNAWWTVATATIDITKPLEADGNGGFLIACGKGILADIVGMDGSLAFPAPFFIVEPGRIGVTELESNGSGYRHVLEAWRDEQRSFGTTIELKLLKKALFLYNSLSQGIEALSLIVDLDFKVDRPVKVNGEAVAVKSKNSIVALSATKANKGIILYDDNILWDNNLHSTQIPVVKPYALAMHNALFTVTPPNGAVLLGEYEDGLKRVFTGNVYLTFGLLSYLPTLPDPYAANLGALKSQFENRGRSQVWLWLVCRVQWENSGEVAGKVGLSFHFAPLKEQFTVLRASASAVDAAGAQIDGLDHSKLFYSNLEPSVAATDTHSTIGVEPDGGLQTFAASVFNRRQLPVGDQLNLEAFSLLDVSSKANQMGIAFTGTQQNFALMRRMGVELNSNREGGTLFPIQVSGLNVVTPGYNARAFTVPQVAWEPVLNVSPPAPNPEPSAEWPNPSNDPPLGWNYFPDDGFATRIGNSSAVPVTLSPIPMAKYLTQMYQHQTDGKTYAVFNLPFGMLAMTILNNQSGQINLPTISNVKPLFNKYIHGGIQLELAAGSSFKSGEDNLFQGLTFQLVNVLDMYGKFNNQSTLGSSVESIFNGEFSKAPANPQDTTRPGVPLTRIGLSGYGANAFSDWHNKGAAFAETSQATFNIVSGRTAHEVVQVKSVIYPWGIFVVRTITLFRLSNGYVGRVDSGWQAESDGKFYFGVRDSANPYEIHTGIVKGLYHIRNIRENELSHGGKMDIKDGDRIFDPNTNAEVVYNGPTYQETATLRGLTFDADFDIEDVIEGAGANNLVPSKQLLGYVQLSPRGTAISSELFRSLLQSQNNSIGGAVNCTIKVAGTNQYMKLNRIDVNNSLDNVDAPIFVAAARGSVVLPKDGSWSMVTHQVSDGTVSPLTQSLSVPLIRIGKWAKDSLANPDDANNLLRIAHPAEILRLPGADTINFGFLQNLNTQKVLFLTPSFKTGFNS
ncbi:hypothetical protein A0256_15390 [Mucilaginibacter sp. PAMC 26640]|nr:hypothetical protein A0256_15390 [Mucilaginibacter sp. PAMC 26640]